MNVKNKVFVVTGGGNGVGREIVLGLLERGAKVAAVDINQDALEETINLSADYHVNLSTHVINIADKELVYTLPERVIEQHGTVDGIVNNAGVIQPFLMVNEINYNSIQSVLNINFLGTLYVTKAFLPYLLDRPEAHITNISSLGALTPIPGETIYGASKAAVKMLSEGLRLELKNTMVRVMIVFPGGISSNIMENCSVETNSRMVLLRKKLKFLLLTPQKAATIIIRGIEHNRYRLTPGTGTKLIDILCGLSPRFAQRMVYSITKAILEP